MTDDLLSLRVLERTQQARADELQRQARAAQREADKTRKRIRRLRREPLSDQPARDFRLRNPAGERP